MDRVTPLSLATDALPHLGRKRVQQALATIDTMVGESLHDYTVLATLCDTFLDCVDMTVGEFCAAHVLVMRSGHYRARD